MDSLSFFVPGIPQGKGRPRVCVKGGRAWAYTPKATVSAEQSVRDAFFKRYGEYDLMYCGIALDVTAIFPYPKSHPKKDREFDSPKTTRIDVDNALKLVMDSGNGHIWHDDSLIWAVKARKIYSSTMPEGILVKIIPTMDINIFEQIA